MSNGLNRRKKAVVDFEAEAAKQRLARQEECSKAINEVLAAHKCQLTVLIQCGDQAVPLEKVLLLPAQMIVASL